MKITQLIILLLVSCFLSCKYRTVKENITKMQSREIVFPDGVMRAVDHNRDTSLCIVGNNGHMKFVHYLDSIGCASCEVGELYLWNDLIKELGSKVDFVFIFAPASAHIKQAINALKAYKSLHVVYIDESGVFGRLNTHIPQDFHYHSFLLDSTNRVTLVGNPTANEDVRKLLYEKVFNLQSAR